MVWARRLDPYFSARAVNPMEVWRFSFEDCARVRLEESIAEYEMVRTILQEKIVSGFHYGMWRKAHRMLKAIIREYRFFLGYEDFQLAEGLPRGEDPAILFHPRNAHVMAGIHSVLNWKEWVSSQLEWCKRDLVEMVTIGRSAFSDKGEERKVANQGSLTFINEMARWGRLAKEFYSVTDPPIFHWKYQTANNEIEKIYEDVDRKIAELDKALTEGLVE